MLNSDFVRITVTEGQDLFSITPNTSGMKVQQVFQECIILVFEILLHHPAHCIAVGQLVFMQFTRPFPFLERVGLTGENRAVSLGVV